MTTHDESRIYTRPSRRPRLQIVTRSRAAASGMSNGQTVVAATHELPLQQDRPSKRRCNRFAALIDDDSTGFKDSDNVDTSGPCAILNSGIAQKPQPAVANQDSTPIAPACMHRDHLQPPSLPAVRTDTCADAPQQLSPHCKDDIHVDLQPRRSARLRTAAYDQRNEIAAALTKATLPSEPSQPLVQANQSRPRASMKRRPSEPSHMSLRRRQHGSVSQFKLLNPH